jgi:hypothetical protein
LVLALPLALRLDLPAFLPLRLGLRPFFIPIGIKSSSRTRGDCGGDPDPAGPSSEEESSEGLGLLTFFFF